MSDSPAPTRPPADEIWTIQRLLQWSTEWLGKSGSTTPRQDADMLLGSVLQLPRLQLLMRFDQPVQRDELAQYKLLIKRRARGEPVAYILGKKGFYDLEITVSPAVLVPRPETESLVDAALAFVLHADSPEGPVLDLCTGSGCVALALRDELTKRLAKSAGTERAIYGSDISPAAMDIARGNGTRLGLAVSWHLGDLWAAVPTGQRFAAIVSNPPYIRATAMATLERDVRDFEPHLALSGGHEGLEILNRIAERAAEFLLPGGWLGVELSDKPQGEAFLQRCSAHGLQPGKLEAVLGGPTTIATVRLA